MAALLIVAPVAVVAVAAGLPRQLLLWRAHEPVWLTFGTSTSTAVAVLWHPLEAEVEAVGALSSRLLVCHATMRWQWRRQVVAVVVW